MHILLYKIKFEVLGDDFIADLYEIWFSNLKISNREKIEILKLCKPEKIWNMQEKELKKLNLKEKIILEILSDENKKNLERYFNYIEKNNIKLIYFYDKRYPSKLKNISKFPAYIYVRGNLENLYEDNVAIVGSRKASLYGTNIAKKIAKNLADKNINIVSGLAIGIDKYAHLGALESKIGKTIAVIATGVSDFEIYPYENKRLFERILENNGTIVSEFRIGTKPEKYNFPLRNRIISALSEKIIVVEAKENSGSLITAEYALEQGKDVYAVPGNITSENSIGTNNLIKEGAYLFSKIEDIFY